MISLYKQKSNNNYMNVCINCIEYKKEIDILIKIIIKSLILLSLSAKITCIEYDNEELKSDIQELKKENQ